MSSNIVNSVAYLRTTRDFPEEPGQLRTELIKAYLDTAGAVNTRTIGLYPTIRPAITGNEYFITSAKQQSLRQLYTFTAAGSIPHGINPASISQFTLCFGSYTDGTNFYGAIFGSNTSIAGQISFYVTSSNIVVLSGAGAPTVTSGTIVLEWLSPS